MKPHIFQITEEIQQQHNLDTEDIGKWCYVVTGTLQGYFDEWGDAKESRDYVFQNE